MADWGPVAGATLVAGIGLIVLYRRLRVECDAATAWLAVTLIAGASPLLRSMVVGDLPGSLGFAALAVGMLSSRYVRSARMEAAALLAAVLLLPFVSPSTRLRPTLFATPEGFLSLTPIVYVALVATWLRTRTRPAESAAVLIAMLLWPATYTALTPAIALLAPGLAAAITWARTKPLVAVAPLIIGTILWNYWLMVQYTAGTIPKDAPVSFAALVRQQAQVHTRAPYVYPFAFPGNLIAAWRQGVPLARYDSLMAEPVGDSFEIRFDRTADRFLLDGWGASGSNMAGPYRMLASERATLVFPLIAQAGGIDLHLLAALRGVEAKRADAAVQINGVEVGVLSVSEGAPTEAQLRIPAANVGGILRAGYNQLTIVSSAPARLAIHRIRITPSA